MGEDYFRRLRTLRRARRVFYRALRPTPRRSHQKTLSQDDGPQQSVDHRRDRDPAQKRSHRKGNGSQRAVPLPHFSNSQALGKTQDDPQPEEDKYLHPINVLSDGESRLHPANDHAQRCGSVIGPPGRISPCANSPQVQGPIGVCHRNRHFPVSGTAFRSETCPAAFHTTGGGGSRVPKDPRAPSVLLPRRLVINSRFGTAPLRTDFCIDKDCQGLGLPYQLGEIKSISDKIPNFPGGGDRHPEPGGPAESEQDSDHQTGCLMSAEVQAHFCQELSAIPGVLGKPRGSSSRLQTPHASFPMAPAAVLPAQQGPPHPQDPGPARNPAPARPLDHCAVPQPGQTTEVSTAFDHGDHGCIPSGMGWSLRGQNGERGMGEQGNVTAYQHNGVPSGLALSSTFSATSSRPYGSDTHGQCHCSSVYQQAGWNAVGQSQCPCRSTMGVVPLQGNHACSLLHPRTGQPDCRFPFSRAVPTIRMDVAPRGHVPHNEDSRTFVGGPLCLITQPPAPSVLLQGTGSEGMGPGRLLHQLEGDSGVRLSPDRSDPQSSAEDQGGPGISPSGGPVLAKTTMVPGGNGPPSGHASDSPSETGSGGPTSLRDKASTAGEPTLNRLAIIGKSARSSGLSDRAADLIARSHRDSTREVYNSRLTAFFEWCDSNDLDPHTAPLGSVADFLITLFDKGRAISTIRGYRSAIAAIHSGFEDGSKVSSSPYLTKLLRAFFLKRPPVKKLVPAWSLPRVLEALAKPPYEPMAKSSLHDLTVKTVFLMAIASGQRRSALHALCLTPGHVRWERHGVRLVPRPTYIAKNQTATSGPVEIVLRPLSEHSSIQEDRVWCPVRAVKWYLDRTKDLRRGDQFFVISREPYSAASKDTISRWIVEAIRAAGPGALVPGMAPRAHDTRGISTSWALFQGVPLVEIQKAAYWSTANSFISFYLRDIPASEEAFACAALSAAGNKN